VKANARQVCLDREATVEINVSRAARIRHGKYYELSPDRCDGVDRDKGSVTIVALMVAPSPSLNVSQSLSLSLSLSWFVAIKIFDRPPTRADIAVVVLRQATVTPKIGQNPA